MLFCGSVKISFNVFMIGTVMTGLVRPCYEKDLSKSVKFPDWLAEKIGTFHNTKSASGQYFIYLLNSLASFRETLF